jgi:hypothetical protein
MASHTAEEFQIYQQMIRKSQRKKRPLVFVEGKFDHKVICKFCDMTKIDVEKISSTARSNKQSLIGLITNNPVEQEFSIGVVDADYDWIYQRLFQKEILPYHQNILDTSPSTDMNTIFINAKGIDEYLKQEGITDSNMKTVKQIAKWMGAIRTLKVRFEENHESIILHLKMKDLRKEIEEGFIPSSIDNLVAKVKLLSPSNTGRFFEDIKKHDRLNKILRRYDNEGYIFHEYVNGHDLSAIIRGLGHKDRSYEIEKRLMNGIDSEVLIKSVLFSKLIIWGKKHNIALL